MLTAVIDKVRMDEYGPVEHFKQQCIMTEQIQQPNIVKNVIGAIIFLPALGIRTAGFILNVAGSILTQAGMILTGIFPSGRSGSIT
jgi:hypothetical protein